MLKKVILISIFLLIVIMFFVFDGQKYLSFEFIKDNYLILEEFTNNNFLLSSSIFIFIYIVSVAFSFPGATILTLIGGFLFGTIIGGTYIVFSATIGASITFLFIKASFFNNFEKYKNKKIQSIQNGIKNNAFKYLLSLRLIPIFPFFLINIAAGLTPISLKTFFIATFFGIIPGTFIYAWVGSGLAFALEQGQSLNLNIIFEPQILFPLLGISFLSFVPSIYKKLKNKGKKNESN